MAMPSKDVTVAEIKLAIEGRNAQALSGFYADNAVLRIIDSDNPPSRPREIRGKAAIGEYYADVCGRNMNHKVEAGLADRNHLAFTQSCADHRPGLGFVIFCTPPGHGRPRGR
jgi:hypothetical protein